MTGADAVWRQYRDAVDDADRAFTAGLITVWEKWAAVTLARLLRDTALTTIRGTQPA